MSSTLNQKPLLPRTAKNLGTVQGFWTTWDDNLSEDYEVYRWHREWRSQAMLAVYHHRRMMNVEFVAQQGEIMIRLKHLIDPDLSKFVLKGAVSGSPNAKEIILESFAKGDEYHELRNNAIHFVDRAVEALLKA
jgi:hypothetical protein